MLVYIVGWIINYGVLFLWMLSFRSRVIIYLSLILLSLIPFFRNSGTDTAAYEAISRNLLVSGSPGVEVEPAFVLLLKTLSAITDSEVLSVRLVALVFLFTLFIFIRRANESEILFVLAFFIPAFFYSYSMNTIRFGLAAMIFLLGFQDLRRGKEVSFWLYSALAFSFHYSIVVIIFILMMFGMIGAKSTRLPRLFLSLLPLVLLPSIAAALDYDHFLVKLDFYSASTAPSLLSGLSKSAVIFFFIILTLVTRLPLQGKVKLVFIYGGLVLFFQMTTLIAGHLGLRLLDLATLAYPLVLLRMYDQNRTPPGRVFLVALCIGGLIGALGSYRNFLLDANGQLTGTLTPFIPYKTILDEAW